MADVRKTVMSTTKRGAVCRLGKALLAGALAGLFVLAADAGLARLMLGYAVALSLSLAAASAGFGMLVCSLFEGLLSATGRRPGTFSQHTATAVASIYGGSIFERVERVAFDSQPQAVAATAGMLALLSYVVWILILARILSKRPSGPSRSSRRWHLPALGLGAATAALGLAANRHLLHRPVEPAALAADAAIVGSGLALALAWRSAARGRRAMAAALAAAVGLGCVVLVLAARSPLRGLPDMGEAPAGKPHLVLLTLDTLRKDVFDQVVAVTPEGRAFREALGPAAWFDNAVAVAPWTAPSMATILTGLHPPEHGYGVFSQNQEILRTTRMDAAIETLAEVLLDQHYFTAAVVTNPYLHPTGGLTQGFLDYEWLQGATGSLPVARFLARIGWLVKDAYQPATVVRRHFERLLERLPARRSVFLWIHLMDPHGPLHAHPDLPRESDGASAPAGRPGPGDEGLYRQETRFLCRELTRFVELLKSRDMWSETLLVMAADHGEMFHGDGHSGRHREKVISKGHGHALYDELVHVPFIVRPPGGLPAERRIDALASHVDLYGTILELLGFEDPAAGSDRVSLAAWLAPEMPAPDTAPRAFALSGALHRAPPRYAIRTSRWKLIHSPSGFEPDELYDLVADPGEKRNLAAEESGRSEELKAMMAAARAELRAPPEPGIPAQLGAEARRQLQALGYVE